MRVEFKAIVLTAEFDLNKIAGHFGIDRKFSWEDSLVLTESSLKGIVRQPEHKMIYLFHFGSMVFINFQHHEIMDVISYLKKLEKGLNTTTPFDYSDDYMLQADATTDSELPSITNSCMVVAKEENFHREIVATILAKSVALEKIEAYISLLMDEIEEIITYLRLGKLNISDERLANLSARIFGFKLNTISYIMMLDKPDITWVNSDASELYDELARLFEMNDRYEKTRQKSEVLIDITEVFSGLTHARRGTRLEWAVIILIAIEIGLSLLDLFVLK